MKSRNRLSRPFGVERAVVSYASTGDRFIHPELFLYDASGSSLIRVKFQAHRLDVADPYSSDAPHLSRPSERFDFGYAYSACYAARWEEGNAYAFGSLRAEPNRSDGDCLRKLARFHDLISKTVSEFNLGHVEPDCELALWVACLEKLGTPVEVMRWVGSRQLDSYAWRTGLPDAQKSPARDFFEQRAARTAAAQ